MFFISFFLLLSADGERMCVRDGIFKHKKK